MTGDDAVRRKLDYVAQHPGFAQTVEDPTWTERTAGGRAEWTVSFKKTSHARDAAPTSVDAYLLWRATSDGFAIVDEGDVVTARTLAVKKDTERENWGNGTSSARAVHGRGRTAYPHLPRWDRAG